MKLSSSLTLLIIITALSCNFGGRRIEGNGILKTENRKIDRATQIKVMGSQDVILVPGATGIKVEADENLLPYIQTEMHGDWLEIKTREDVNIDSRNPIRVYVSTPAFTKVSLTGSGNFTCDNQMSVEEPISLSIVGSGNLTAALHAPDIEADITGSGVMELNGEAKNVDVEVRGSGNFKGFSLKAENADVSISGSGDANVFADQNLKASVTGSGNISYKGAASVQNHVTGSGTISKAE